MSVARNLPWSFGLSDWLPATAPSTIEASTRDTSQRPIGVTFFLEDPRARTPYLWMKPPDIAEYHFSSEEGAINIWIRSTEEHLVQSLLIGLHSNSAHAGMIRSAALATSIVSAWCFQCQRPVGIREVAVEDKSHGATWSVRPQAQLPLKLNQLGASFQPAHALGSLMAVFREGMASVQPAYRFLCYYKVLEAWKVGDGQFKSLDGILQAKGKRRDKSKLIVKTGLFPASGVPSRFAEVVGKKFTWCIDQMNEARKLIAHSFDDSETFVSLDSGETQIYLSDWANFAERMAIVILTEELRLMASVGDAKTTERVLAMYVHESWGADLLQKIREESDG